MKDLSNYKPEWVPVSHINFDNKLFQFRKEITAESMKDLVASIAEEGQKFPVTLWRKNSGELIAVSGYRRITAAKFNNWEKVLAVIVPEYDMNEDEALKLNFVENMERKSLSSLDIMFACQKLSASGKSNVDIGRLICKSEKQVRRYLIVANASAETQAKVQAGEMTIEQAGGKQLGLEAEQNIDKSKYTVNTSRNAFTSRINITITPQNEATFNAYIADLKKAWKAGLKQSKKKASNKPH